MPRNDVTGLPPAERPRSVVTQPLMSGRELYKALGFRTPCAFFAAERNQRLPVTVFKLPGRRGRFAFTADVQQWIASLPSAGSPRATPDKAFTPT